MTSLNVQGASCDVLAPRPCTSRRCGPSGRPAFPLRQGLAGIATPARSRGFRRGLQVHAGLDQLPNLATGAASSLHSALDHIVAAATPHLLTLADVADAVASDAGEAVAKDEGGVFGFLANSFEKILKVLDTGLERVGVPYSYGFAIILLTVMVKLATYPLSKQQVESTISMQALQPRVKDLQAKYKNDPERLQMETARLYKEAGVNPLAGCLPTLATIPVWIGLYKALSNVANEGLLTEGFFWIPSLGGPATLAAQQEGGGLAWLFPLQNGAPPIGWSQAAAYLVLPVLLVVSQAISQQALAPPKSDDPAQQQTQAILKFLPLMIGWFSLNVPSGLTLYWFTNNVLTTGQQLYLRRGVTPAAAGASGAVVDIGAVKTETVEDEPKRVTGKDLNARRSKKQKEVAEQAQQPQASGSQKGQKFKAIKAREAARKAAQQAQAQAGGEAEGDKAEGAVATERKVVVPDAPPAKDNGSHATKDNGSA